MTAKPTRARIVCAPCGEVFESVAMQIAAIKFGKHACPAPPDLAAPIDLALSDDDPVSVAADYLDRLRRVDRVLEGHLDDPARFIARIRAAIGVLPDQENPHAT
jgi:hypothetical protein